MQDPSEIADEAIMAKVVIDSGKSGDALQSAHRTYTLCLLELERLGYTGRSLQRLLGSVRS